MIIKPKQVLTIKTQKQWDAISSPTRAAILEAITALGNCSVKEIAHSIGRSAELVHHHLPVLLETGFVLESEPRKSGRHFERMFLVGAERWEFDTESDRKTFIDGFRKMAKAWSRANERMLSERLGQFPEDQNISLTDVLTLRSETGRLSPEAYQQVRNHLEAIKNIFQEERKTNEGELQTIFWSAFEVPSKKQSKSASLPKKPQMQIRQTEQQAVTPETVQ